MHVFDESTNIAANLHCLWLIFHLASREDNFTIILEISSFRNEAIPGCRSTYQQFLAKNLG